MTDVAGKKAQLAELKAQLNEKTAEIRRLKAEGGEFMHIVQDINTIKGKMSALGVGGKGKKNKNAKKGQKKGVTKSSATERRKKGGKNSNNNNNDKTVQQRTGTKPHKKTSDRKSHGFSQTAAKSESTTTRSRDRSVSNASAQTTNQVVGIFSHLQPNAGRAKKLATSFSDTEKIHPAIIKMGLKFSQGILDSVNSRTVGMLTALKAFVTDVELDQTVFFGLELGKLITVQINHLVTSRRHTLAMGNVINWLKSSIALLDSSLPHDVAKHKICTSINYFIAERIKMASQVIVKAALGKIQDGDVILTVSRYNVVENILMKLTEVVRSKKLDIRIIVTDSPPDFHGKRMIKKIASAGVSCTYAPLNALSYVMQDVTKVFVGASALAANGAVIAHSGTALVGMAAKAQGIPVLVCAETYKFCERVQVDAIVENELSDVDQLVFSLEGDMDETEEEVERREASEVYCPPSCLGLIYDLTPPEFVTALVTEFGIIPPTSVPVIIREAKDRQGT